LKKYESKWESSPSRGGNKKIVQPPTSLRSTTIPKWCPFLGCIDFCSWPERSERARHLTSGGGRDFPQKKRLPTKHDLFRIPKKKNRQG